MIITRVRAAVKYRAGRKHTMVFWNADDVLFLDLENNYMNICFMII